MRVSIPVAVGEESAHAIPVSPVRLDLGALRTPPVAWTTRLRLAMVAVLSLGVHAALLVTLEPQAPTPDQEEAIPIEMIFEPPPEPTAPEGKPAEEPPPEQAAQPLDEKPANDFARTADQDRQDGKAAAPSAAPTPEREAAPPEQKIDVAPEPPAPDPALALAPPSAPSPDAKAAPRFADLAPLPDYQFTAPLAKRSDLPKGSAPPGYLSTLYGLIMRKMENVPPQTRPARGRVTFAVMGNGRIVQEAIAISSGAPFLDAAALAAVRKAAPFPAPPQGGPIYIRFDYGAD